MSYTQLTHSYTHIDNGGISVDFGVDVEEDFKIPVVTISTAYHGHASVSSRLQGFELTPQVLREIGTKFIEFAAMIEQGKINGNT